VNISSPLIAEMKNKEYRDGYVAAQIALGLPSKIRALRTERQWTQGDLARLAKMAQPRISEIETPGERKLNLDTLQRIASAFDVGLEVNFVPFGELIEQSERFDPDSFSVQSFEPELAAVTVETLNRKSIARRKSGMRHRHKRALREGERHMPSIAAMPPNNPSGQELTSPVEGIGDRGAWRTRDDSARDAFVGHCARQANLVGQLASEH
jgi:transcriptional regulator with XRE-family HTH domain